MYHKKKSVLFIFAVLIFSLCDAVLFGAAKHINSLTLNFEQRTEIIKQTDQTDAASSQMSGYIIYNENPFVFIFQATSPLSQVLYLNADGAYVIEGDTVHDFSDAAEFLKQTCKDFLNWFDDDLGLKDGLYASTGFSLQDGNVVSTWNYTGKDAPPVDSILAVSDSFGRFTKLEMFTEQHELITATTLQDFGCNSGCFYPKKICSVSYEGEEPVVSTELYLSDVKFNAAVDKAYLSRKEYSIQAGDDISVAHKYARPSVPAAVNYRVSIPSILVNTSFKFYKKYITAQDMSNCPFYPSCSQYMLDAVSMNGLFGIIQGWERLHRCTDTEHKRNMYPVMKDGRHYDPVNKLW